MSDALSLLRNSLINHKEFNEEEDKIVFGDVYYPKDTKTNYVIYGYVCGRCGELGRPLKRLIGCFRSGKNGETKDYYTLECLAFLVKNVELQHSIYIKNASVSCLYRQGFRAFRLELLPLF
jgi:parafibromin